MATYEYRCQDCQSTFTISERISKHEERKSEAPACPSCGGRDTRQVFSAFYAKTSSKT